MHPVFAFGQLEIVVTPRGCTYPHSGRAFHAEILARVNSDAPDIEMGDVYVAMMRVPSGADMRGVVVCLLLVGSWSKVEAARED
jgi:hypothetical protein